MSTCPSATSGFAFARFKPSVSGTPTGATDDVLFGGLDSAGTRLNQTWLFDSTGWHQLSPAHSPPPICNAAMTWDDANGVDVLFGGVTASGYSNQTWLWNGNDWTQATLAASPPSARGFAMLAENLDTTTGTVADVLFGGVNASGYLGDTWFLKDTTPTSNAVSDTWAWTAVSPGTSPSARSAGAMALDANDDDVLFGGQNGSSTSPTYLGDTWIFDGANWTRQAGTGPSPRAFPQMNYMEFPGTSTGDLLFGGLNSSGPLSDTWLWAGTTWSQSTTTHTPPARWEGGLDEFQAATTKPPQSILFGGVGTSSSQLSDTWAYNDDPTTQSGSSVVARRPWSDVSPPLALGAVLALVLAWGMSRRRRTVQGD